MNKVCFLYIVTAGCTVGCMYNTNNVNVRGSASGEIRAGICCSKNCKLVFSSCWKASQKVQKTQGQVGSVTGHWYCSVSVCCTGHQHCRPVSALTVCWAQSPHQSVHRNHKSGFWRFNIPIKIILNTHIVFQTWFVFASREQMRSCSPHWAAPTFHFPHYLLKFHWNCELRSMNEPPPVRLLSKLLTERLRLSFHLRQAQCCLNKANSASNKPGRKL